MAYRIARALDPWHNLWWLYEPTTQPLHQDERDSDTDWHDHKPNLVYDSLMDACAPSIDLSEHESPR